MITYDEFKKLDIRIATIESASRIEGADKLLKLILDLGAEKRQILAGIAEFIEDPETLVGKQIPVLVNLEPRKMRGEESQGMMLAADVEGKPILLHPETKIPPGSTVR
jgi:methionine--tRNA ligase beta chain